MAQKPTREKTFFYLVGLVHRLGEFLYEIYLIDFSLLAVLIFLIVLTLLIELTGLKVFKELTVFIDLVVLTVTAQLALFLTV